MRTKNKQSKYTGVSWYAYGNKWKAYLTINRKVYHLGHFEDEEEAHKAVLEAKNNPPTKVEHYEPIQFYIL